MNEETLENIAICIIIGAIVCAVVAVCGIIIWSAKTVINMFTEYTISFSQAMAVTIIGAIVIGIIILVLVILRGD